MGLLRWVSSFKLEVSFAEYSLVCRALLQKRPIILRSLLIEATPYQNWALLSGGLDYTCVTCLIHLCIYICETCIYTWFQMCVYIYMRHAYIHVTCLIYLCVYIYVWHVCTPYSSVYVFIWDMHSYVTMCIWVYVCIWDMHSYVTCLTYLCDTTHSCMWHAVSILSDSA